MSFNIFQVELRRSKYQTIFASMSSGKVRPCACFHFTIKLLQMCAVYTLIHTHTHTHTECGAPANCRRLALSSYHYSWPPQPDHPSRRSVGRSVGRYLFSKRIVGGWNSDPYGVAGATGTMTGGWPGYAAASASYTPRRRRERERTTERTRSTTKCRLIISSRFVPAVQIVRSSLFGNSV